MNEHRRGTAVRMKRPAGGRDKASLMAAQGFMLFLCGLVVCLATVVSAGSGDGRPETAAGQAKAAGDGGQGSAQAGPSESVVARVNGVSIMSGSLERMIRVVEAEPARQGHAGPVETNTAEIRGKALDRLIFQELVFQKAESEGMKISKADIDVAVENLKARAGGEESYRAQLKAMARTEDEMRASVERSLMIERLYRREVTDRISVTEETVKEQYERNRDKFVIPEVTTVIDVVFFLDPASADSLRKVQEIREKILANKEEDPWSLEPDGTFIVRELGLKKNRDKELYPEARKLREGELSGVIRTHDSLHLLLLKKYSPEKQVQFEQVKSLIEQRLRASEKDERIREWEAELRKVANIEIIGNQGNKGVKE